MMIHYNLTIKQYFQLMKGNQQKYANALGIQIPELSNFGIVRKAYKTKMLDAAKDRTTRIKINRAYSDACASIFKSSLSELQIYIIEGNLQGLKSILQKNRSLLNERINKYPIIYLAVRSGHYDITELILRLGCSLDFKDCISTPMHCAAYYGHYSIVPLLLLYGVPIDIKNQYGDLPVQESATPQIKNLLTIYKGNKIQELNERMIDSGMSYPMINLLDKKKVVQIKKLVTRNYFKYLHHKQYDDAFHGTSLQNVFSIVKFGLKKPGDIVDGKSLKIVPGHIPLGTNFQGKKDWSRAIFVTPSIYYAADPVYAKQFIEINDNSAWLPIIQVKIKKGGYTRHDHTLKNYDVKNNEPTCLQFRVQCQDQNKDLIMRSESSENVIVVAVIFLRKGLLDYNENYNEITEMIMDSRQEEFFRKLNK